MAGYIGSKSSVTQVDGYNRTEADNRYVNASGDTMTGNLSTTGNIIAVNAGNSNLTRLTLKGTSSEWSISNYGTQVSPNNSFVIADETNAAGRFFIDTSGRVTMPYQPAFDAYNFVPLVGSGSIVWTATRFNTGNHFNTSTGLFTAPVAGVYSFNFSILMQASETVAYQRILFNINASRSTTFFDSLVGGVTGASGAFEGYNYIALTGTKTMKLNANDSVGLWNDSPHDTWANGNFGHFSGYLIG